MVNAENIRKVIAMIENESNFFDMSSWNTDDEKLIYPPNVCGTPSCIGGWGEAIMRFENKIDKNRSISTEAVGEWLGLSYKDGENLFFPHSELYEDDVNPAYRATRYQAVAHLKHIIETGEVNWDKFTMDKFV